MHEGHTLLELSQSQHQDSHAGLSDLHAFDIALDSLVWQKTSLHDSVHRRTIKSCIFPINHLVNDDAAALHCHTDQVERCILSPLLTAAEASPTMRKGMSVMS